MKNILFIVSAGKIAGMGHLMRSVVAAEALEKSNLSVGIKFITIGDLIPKNFYIKYSHDHFEDIDTNNFINQFHEYQPSLIVFDLHEDFNKKTYQNLCLVAKKIGIKIVNIDGLNTCAGSEDLLYIPSFYLSKKNLSNSSIIPTIYGWDCYLLRAQPCNKNNAESYEDNKHKSVLVLTGGSDLYGLGKVWPKLLNEIGSGNIIIDWVVGPFSEAPRLDFFKKNKFNLHISPPELNRLIEDADYALCVYGVSFFELLKFGKPVVVYAKTTASDEIQALKKEGVALVSSSPEEAVIFLSQLFSNNKKSRRLLNNGAIKMSLANGKRFRNEVEKLLLGK